MATLKINGVDIREPMSLEYQVSDLDSEEGSGRDQTGQMFRDRVATKVKLVVTFPALNDREISELLHAVEPTFFSLEYPDAYLGRINTITAYVGDRTSPIYIRDIETDMWIWQGVSMNFIER